MSSSWYNSWNEFQSDFSRDILVDALERPKRFNFNKLLANVESTYKTCKESFKLNANSMEACNAPLPLKSNEKAVELRLRGNSEYKKGLDKKALLLYTESVALAVDGSEELALAYANRSASLLRSGKFIECLLDINRALEGNYPVNLRGKLKDRKEKCLVEIRGASEKEHEFERIDGNETDRPIEAQNSDDAKWRLMCQFGNSLIPHSSPKMKLECDKERGTHIVAIEDVEPDTNKILYEKFDTPEDVVKFCYVAILAPQNDHCLEIYTKILNLIPGEAKSYISTNRLISKNDSEILLFPIEFLDSLELMGLPPNKLNLKVDAIVMLPCNMNVALGLLNGTRLIVRKMHTNALDMEILMGGMWLKDITPKSGFVTSRFHRAILIQKMYCSKTCRLQAKESYHYMECKILKVNRQPYSKLVLKVLFLALRALFIGTKQGAQLKSLMEKLELKDIFAERIDLANKPFSDDYLSVLRICRTFNLSVLEVGVYATLESIVMLRRVGFFENFFPRNDRSSAGTDDDFFSLLDEAFRPEKNRLTEVELFVTMLLLNHFGTLMGHSSEVTEFIDWVIPNVGSCEKSVGVNLCPLFHLLNHSCIPNVQYLMTKNRELVLFANRPIKKGEQLLIAVCGGFAEKSRETRKLQLAQPYGIICQCEACINNWPQINDLRVQKPEFVNNRLACAVDFRREVQPIFERIVEGDYLSSLSNRELVQLAGKILKWIHANVKNPSYVINICEFQLYVLMMLLYNDSSREFRNATQIDALFGVIMRCITDMLKN